MEAFFKEEKAVTDALIKTLVFFDLFNYPLNFKEIHKYLPHKISTGELLLFLDYHLPKAVEKKEGFYFLRGREEIIIERQKRYNYSLEKYKIAKKVSRLFSLCPFVRLVAVSNIIGSHNLRASSDIDFFIITSPRRLWLTRLYCAGWAKLLNLRPTENNKKNKICLSFYASEEQLDLSGFKLNQEDYYFFYWLLGLQIIFERKNLACDFQRANQWLFDYLPNAYFPEASPYIKKSSSYHGFFRLWGGSWHNFLEKMAKKIELKIMPRALKEAESQGVVINDRVLKLYLKDRREEFITNYKKHLEEIKQRYEN